MTDPIRHLAEAGRLDRFYVDGAWREGAGAERVAVVSPASETVIAEIALGTEADVAHAVAAA
ncbi:aldehyde dehydrogenase family protein, partial [Methylobacterium sp. IIF4SW-B5]|nr:aldehyde dehydrogenase family protein [Methylobacterium ajmalii]